MEWDAGRKKKDWVGCMKKEKILGGTQEKKKDWAGCRTEKRWGKKPKNPTSGVVSVSNGDSVSGELMAIGSCQDEVSLDLGVDDLADCILVGLRGKRSPWDGWSGG
jgi:hypothetical protein